MVNGLTKKYSVLRVDGTDGPGGRHENCWYFVLDPAHDPTALLALKFYQLYTPNKALSADLRNKIIEFLETYDDQ